MEFLQSILQVLGTTAGVTVLLIGVARLLPDSKLYGLGYRWGVALSALGTLKLGSKWQPMEDFAEKSFGKLLQGFQDGLNADDSDTTPDSSSK